jgi:tetratricopeptide (TPR) repeat protein
MRSMLVLALTPAMLLAQTPEKLFQDRKFPEARAAAETQLKTNKNDGSAMYWMGRTLYQEGKIKESADWFEKAVKADDKNAQYHLWLGNAVGDEAENASKIRQPFLAKKVKNEFERAVDLDPTLVDARQGLANFYQMAPGFMGGSNAKAREQIAEIKKLNPYRGHFSTADYARRDKDLPGTLKAWEAAIAEFPDSTTFYYRLAGDQRQQTKWDDAFATYERILKEFPNETVPHLGWGAVAALSGKQLEKGESELKWFIANTTVEKVGTNNTAGAHFRLGQIYEKTNRRNLAKPEYEETLKINPQHADAKKALAALK